MLCHVCFPTIKHYQRWVRQVPCAPGASRVRESSLLALRTVHTRVWDRRCGSGTLTVLPGLTVGEGTARISISETEAAPLSDEKTSFPERRAARRGKQEGRSLFLLCRGPASAGRWNPWCVCAWSEGGSDGLPGRTCIFWSLCIVWREVSSHPHSTFHKHSPHKQHVFSQPYYHSQNHLQAFRNPLL